MDSESYVHRIGRTGRAGRAGRALLFVENRERRLLRNIERTMKLTIPEVELPNAELLGERRLAKFAAKVQQQLESSDLDLYRALLTKLQPEEELDMETRRSAAENGTGRTSADPAAGSGLRRVSAASSTTVTIVAVIVATVATAVIAVTATVRVANVVTLAKCSCTASKWAVTMA